MAIHVAEREEHMKYDVHVQVMIHVHVYTLVGSGYH